MQVPAVGDVLAGKYAVEAIVGRGGMGVVLAARHLELDERVAIKLILADASVQGAEFTARFVREAKLASKIKSEHVVRVIDVARLESGEPYIVMELLEGQDLAELLAKHGPLAVPQAALYVLQACEALAEAHALGIVHRDLKPANFFLATTRDGRPCVKVLDFGISKLMGADAAQSMTKTNALMGSPLYMSPDQLIQSRDVDARSDIWALGITLFELLTGRCPFAAEEAPQLIAHILHTPPLGLRTLRGDVPAELEGLVNAALVKDRTQRIQDVAGFARGLAPFAGDVGRFSVDRITGLLARSGRLSANQLPQQAWVAPGVTPVASTSATSSGSSLDLGSTRRPSRALPVLAVLGGLAALAIVSFVLLRGSGPAADAASSAQVPSPASPTPSMAPVLAPAPETAPTAAPVPEPAALASAPPAPSSSPSAAQPASRKPVSRPAAAARPAKPAAATPASGDPFGGVR